MPQVTIVYWRDIPAQVIVGADGATGGGGRRGRGGAKLALSERFEQAIDRCAMRTGARDSDAYLAEWRRAEPFACDGTPEGIARAEAARLEALYDPERLRALVENGGRA